MTRLDPSLKALDAAKPHAIVIGAGLGGLSAAMRLGAKGYRVTVVDKLDTVGGRGSSITKGGHRFDLGPTIVTVPQVFEELWEACGRSFRDDIDLREMDPFYEIRWPDGSSFTMSGNEQAVAGEVAKLNPGDVAGYKRFLKEAEARYWFGFEDLGRRPMHKFLDLAKVLPKFAWMRADRSVYAHAAKRFKDDRLRMAFSFHPLFIGGDPLHVTSMYILVSHLEKEFGVHYAMGGVQQIATKMGEVIEGQGGLIRLDTEGDEILIKDGAAKGIRLSTGEIMGADIVVSNADAGHTYTRLLRNHKRRRWTDARMKRTRLSMGLFVWYFGTKGTAGQWGDVGHHTILNGPRYQGLLKDIFMKQHLAEDMSLYVHRPSVTDPSVAPAGDDTFYALSPVPHIGGNAPVDWEDMRETYKDKVAKVLDQSLIPGFRDHITSEMTLTPSDFESRYLSPAGAGFSIEPRILQSAWFRPHNISEEARGLYLVGAGTHPGAGLPGVVSTAEVLAKLVPDAQMVAAE